MTDVNDEMRLSSLETDWLSLAQIRQAVRDGDFTSHALREHYLRRIQKHNPSLGAFVSMDDPGSERVFPETAGSDHKRALEGIPFGVKDNYDCRGYVTTYGSEQFREDDPARVDSAEVQSLRMQGGVPLGKTNLPEFAGGVVTTNAIVGDALNPYDTSVNAGGSSGGSASAVAAGLVPFATGSDGGGSIRIPASFCGVVGMKPSNGLISPPDIGGGGAGLSCFGVITRYVDDAALSLSCLAKGRWRATDWNLHASRNPKPGFLRVGWWHGLRGVDVSPEVLDVTVPLYRRLCGRSDVSSVKLADRYLPCDPNAVFEMVVGPEWLSNIYRFTGVDADPARLSEYFAARVERISRLSLEDYARGSQQRAMLIRFMDSIFSEVDVVISPTTAVVALPSTYSRERIGPGGTVLDNMDAVPFTRIANLCRLPAISVPAGYSSDGLPVGIHMMAKHGCDMQLLRAAKMVEGMVERMGNKFTDS